MSRNGKGWIVGAVSMVMTALSVFVLAQDTTVPDAELRRWLTNETFPLRTDVVDVRDDKDE